MNVTPRAYWETVHANFETGRVEELILHVFHDHGTARIHIRPEEPLEDMPSPDVFLQQLENLQVAMSQIVLERGRIFPH